jgi:hypothetical protein
MTSSVLLSGREPGEPWLIKELLKSGLACIQGSSNLTAFVPEDI